MFMGWFEVPGCILDEELSLKRGFVVQKERQQGCVIDDFVSRLSFVPCVVYLLMISPTGTYDKCHSCLHHG